MCDFIKVGECLSDSGSLCNRKVYDKFIENMEKSVRIKNLERMVDGYSEEIRLLNKENSKLLDEIQSLTERLGKFKNLQKLLEDLGF